jgi:hypothetical protein
MARNIDLKLDRASIDGLVSPVRRSPVRSELETLRSRTEWRAKRYAPGKMKKRTRGEIVNGRVIVSCDHPATLYVIYGTRPHVIKPVFKQALEFKVNGRTTFAKKVNHPGTRANNFMLRALREASMRR